MVGATTKAGGPHYLHGLVHWEDAPTWLTNPESSSGADGEPNVDPSWLHTAQKLDEQTWTTVFGPDQDISALRAERNVLRHVPTPVLVRWEHGPAEHLLRVVSAGLRAGAPMTVSINPVPSTEEGDAPNISSEGVRGQVEQLRREFQGTELGAPVDIHVEPTGEFHRRAQQLAEVPPTAEGGGDARIRLISDWVGDRAGALAAKRALQHALGGTPDVAVYAGPVVSAGEVELLPFVHEQAISITAHRFGTPDHLTDEIL